MAVTPPLFTDIQVSGISYAQFIDRIKVVKSVNYQTDYFEATIYNTAGSRANTFTIGNDVKIYHDTGSPAANQIFLGRLEYIKPDSKPNSEILTLGGRDYTSVLMDSLVQAIYTSGTNNVCEVGSVVRDLIYTSAVSGTIGIASVSGTSKVVSNFRIKNKTLFESINQLASFVGYNFWVDFSKVLHFQPQNTVVTGYTLDNTNVDSVSVNRNSQQLANQITVYGSKTLVRKQETFTADGAGSVFTLVYNPIDTYVTDGGVQKQGGVFNQMTSLPTGAQYLYSYDLKQIIFISGTSVGSNIPVSGNSIVVQYSRGLPIVKQAVDDVSIATYTGGLPKEDIVDNANITDPKQAQDIAYAELNKRKNPAIDATISISSNSISGVQPGQTVIVNLPNDSLSGVTLTVFQTNYDINEPNLYQGNTIDVRAGTRANEMSDLLKNLIIKTADLQASSTDAFDTITKLRQTNGSFGLRAHYYMKMRTGLGSSFVLGNANLGMLGSNVGQVPQNYLGDSRAALVLVQSGGDFRFTP